VGHPGPTPTSASASATATRATSTPGDGTAGTPRPTATGTSLDGYGDPPAPVVAALTGVWATADGTVQLVIGADGSFTLTRAGTTSVSGDLASRDSTLSLISDAGGRAEVIVGSAEKLTLVSPDGERLDLTRAG
jgi:hypothetical protein